MTNFDEKLAPRPISGVDFKSLSRQPSAEDFFVLSRIDGSTTVGQLCTITGLGRAKTIDSIDRLHSLGLIEVPGHSSLAASTSSSASDDLGPEVIARFNASFESFPFDPELLAQQVELEEPFKKEVLFVFHHLDEVNYYQLLGTSPDADRRVLRKNYFAMSKRYHPDRFFRKVLGGFEPMIDRIFQQITSAYQTLSHRDRRADYDAALQEPPPPAAPFRARSSSQVGSSSLSPNSEAQDRKKEVAFKLLARRAAEAFDSGAVDSAVGEYRKALSLKRDLPLALEVSQRLSALPDRLDDALAFARAAYKIDPSSPEALILLGDLSSRKGNSTEALHFYEKALHLSPAQEDLRARINQLQSTQ